MRRRLGSWKTLGNLHDRELRAASLGLRDRLHRGCPKARSSDPALLLATDEAAGSCSVGVLRQWRRGWMS